MEETNQYKYLGFIISNRGDNMANIEEKRKISIGKTKTILSKLNQLNLQKYHFEAGKIFLLTMLRPSILFGCEAYYNLTEQEIRKLEEIEENYLVKLFVTLRSCARVQLYREAGIFPLRFQIMKSRLLYLKYILEQTEESKLFQFLKLQFEQPSNGDWASMCLQDMKTLNIEESLQEIKMFNKKAFIKKINANIKMAAIKYLEEKRKKKGGKIEYLDLQMSEYLQPDNHGLSIKEKCEMFAFRNGMTLIRENFTHMKLPEICLCGDTETLCHIYSCILLNNKKSEEPFEALYNGEIKAQIKAYRRLSEAIIVKFEHFIE